jgi:DNA-binding FadR family transcriptional regulator
VGRIHGADDLAGKLTDLILARGLRPGDPLPSEASLTQDLDIGRNSLREAIKSLQALGIIDVRHGRGTFVGSVDEDPLRNWLVFRTRSADDQVDRLRDLLDVREILETEIAKRAARSADKGSLLERLAVHVAKIRDDTPDAAAADRQFHEDIAAHVDMLLARSLIRAFWDAFQSVNYTLDGELDAPDVMAYRHQSIIDAIASGNPGLSEEAMHAHFDGIRRRLRLRDFGAR